MDSFLALFRLYGWCAASASGDLEPRLGRTVSQMFEVGLQTLCEDLVQQAVFAATAGCHKSMQAANCGSSGEYKLNFGQGF